ncbi:MAG: O-antigen ligase family protein [Coriobacteriia bacterium]|nr:O-antigen ligase family protein [Coriobacteriia bacterium]
MLRALGFETRVFVILFVATVFSGSLLRFATPYMIVSQVVLLSWMAVSMPGKRPSALVNIRHLWPLVTLLIFDAFLFWQLSHAYAPTITQTYGWRFLVFSMFLVFIPRIDVCFTAIKIAKWYSGVAAASIVIMALATGERTGGLVGSYHFGGMMMSVACILFLLDYFQNGGRRVDALGFALALVGLFVSGKRMFALLAVLAFALLYLASTRRAGKRRSWRLALLGTGAVFPLYFTVEPVRELASRLQLFSLDAYAATSGRNLLWEVAIDVFRSHPLTGIGFGNFAVYLGASYSIKGVGEYLAHNIYVGLLAETGVVGFALFVGLMLYSLVFSVSLLRNLRSAESPISYYVTTYSVAMQLWFIVYGFTGNGIYGWHEFFFYISAVSMAIAVRIDQSRARRPWAATNIDQVGCA